MSGWRYAFSLSKADVKDAQPPGTLRLLDQSLQGARESEGGRVKFPRPSADPADPLNWSAKRKIPILLVASLYAFASNFISSVIAPAFQLWPSVYPNDPKPVSSLTYLVAAVYTVALCGGSVIGGVSGGYIGFHLGWAYIFWIKTLYERPHPERGLVQDESSSGQKAEDAGASHIEGNDYEPCTFVRSLGISKPRGSLYGHFINPWVTLALPGTWVVMLHYGGLVGGIVTISIVGAQIVAAPPYNWGANAGLINVGGIIGTLLGALYTYVTSDALLKRRASRSGHGLAEPEVRLPAMFPALILATCGFFVFGFCADNSGGSRWVGLEVGFAMISFGLMQLPSIGFTYVRIRLSTLTPIAQPTVW
ncbi:hypothetical protein QQX98_007649 [Neonectria punicea]|uniref:Uncharacterized protein n=1 Tax=Neonectria punicea TaxID=979145 RepID=A0ABR1GXF1_9HYPO